MINDGSQPRLSVQSSAITRWVDFHAANYTMWILAVENTVGTPLVASWETKFEKRTRNVATKDKHQQLLRGSSHNLSDSQF